MMKKYFKTIRNALLISVLACSNLNAKIKIFKWEKIINADSYRIRICSEENCKNIIFEADTRDTTYKRNLNPGVYFFSLAPISRTGKIGIWTQKKEFRVVPDNSNLTNQDKKDKSGNTPLKNIKLTPQNHMISFNILYGKPAASLLEDHNDYTSVSKNNLEAITSVSISYKRRINNFAFNIFLLRNFIESSTNLSLYSIDGRFTFDIRIFKFSPIIGIHRFNLKGTNNLSGAFNLSPYTQPYLGCVIRINPNFLQQSSFVLELFKSGFFDVSNLSKLFISYEHSITDFISASIGYFQIELNGSFRPQENYLDKKNISEKYSGSQIKIIFSF